MKIKQIFHHYSKWEDWKAGMWRKESKENEEIYLGKAIPLISDHLLYGSWMMRVIEEWPFACEQNLTERGLNRRAWIGHAAVCLAINCPEYITRMAWWHLTEEQQKEANKQADLAIKEWETRHINKISNKTN